MQAFDFALTKPKLSVHNVCCVHPTQTAASQSPPPAGGHAGLRLCTATGVAFLCSSHTDSSLMKPPSRLQVAMQDFDCALSEVKPAFGAVTETLEQHRLNGIIDCGEHFRHLQSTCRTLVEQVGDLSGLSDMGCDMDLWGATLSLQHNLCSRHAAS